MRPTCRFRFPVGPGQSDLEICPKCGGPLQRIENPYTDLTVESAPLITNGLEVEALLDNIRSTFNVGAMFRTADGAGVRHMHLAGVTPTPDHPKVGKTALGAEYAVPWTLHWDSLEAVRLAKQQGMRLWALEGGQEARSLFELGAEREWSPIMLAVGNEVSGLDPGILELCDKRISIPMQGVKRSLNVSIAFGVAVYYLKYR